ncbi:hypothetical protein [Xylella taiwanensis]|uniref:hypothetical protein n=1 Tax=Xylella taiwanensis TaxID=1444770 RepID=UPI001E4751D8|nr:hypothetical protein [Xylella taiwanensis]UFN06535.1 hypothetical protein LPH42_10225 [Xylella taiwanensis]
MIQIVVTLGVTVVGFVFDMSGYQGSFDVSTILRCDSCCSDGTCWVALAIRNNSQSMMHIEPDVWDCVICIVFFCCKGTCDRMSCH